jgi:transposase
MENLQNDQPATFFPGMARARGAVALMCLRRLHRGQFIWPQPGEACWHMSAEQWQWLVAGVDWQRLSAPAPAQWRL